jgi:hypothetical protein
MPYLSDGSPCSAVPGGAKHSLVAIGWLDADHPFSTGAISEEGFRGICAHLTSPWEPPFATAGYHHCNFCQFGTSASEFRGYRFSSRSSSELFIPTGSRIFVSPVSIAHYIAAHRYLPPAEFIAAVLACPPQGSVAYLKLLLDSGGRSWLKAVQTFPDEFV